MDRCFRRDIFTNIKKNKVGVGLLNRRKLVKNYH